MKCRFSLLTPPPTDGRAALFLPLEQPTKVVFQGAFPGSNVEGKGDHSQLNNLFTHFTLLILFFVNFYYRKQANRRWKNKRVEREVEKNCSLCFFSRAIVFFSHTWILGDELGRVFLLLSSNSNPSSVGSCMRSPGSVGGGETVPFLSSRDTTRRDTQVVHKLQEETKLCQVAAHPAAAADAKIRNCVSQLLTVDYYHGPREHVQRMKRIF